MSTKVKLSKHLHKVADSVTRPGNTTAYAVGDVVSASDNSHLTLIVPEGGTGSDGYIRSATLMSSANQGTKLDAELWLFSQDIGDTADNAAFAPTDAQLANLITIIDFPVADWIVGTATAGAAGNAVCIVTGLDIPAEFDGATLYGQLVARNTYTPVSGEVLTVTLRVERN